MMTTESSQLGLQSIRMSRVELDFQVTIGCHCIPLTYYVYV